MEPLREISEEEYYAIVKNMRQKAYLMADDAEKKGWEFPILDSPHLYFYNNTSPIPCLYRGRNKNVGSMVYNPRRKRDQLAKPIPKEYKTKVKNSLYDPHHLVTDGCPKLIPFRSIVKCAFKDNKGKYYTCEHLVGDCPAKE